MEEIIAIPNVPGDLRATLNVTVDCIGLVLFPLNYGDSKLCDRLVAEEFQNNRIGTLSLDLLTQEEALEYERRFNIELLTERLVQVAHMVEEDPATSSLPLGLYGSGFNVAAVLRTGAGLQHQIKAIVTVGGDPEQALPVVHQITAPVLQIVGNVEVLQVNSGEVFDKLSAQKELKTIAGFDSFFKDAELPENTSAVSEIASLAVQWFHNHLGLGWKNTSK